MELIKTLTGDLINTKYITCIKEFIPEDCYCVFIHDQSTPFKVKREFVDDFIGDTLVYGN